RTRSHGHRSGVGACAMKLRLAATLAALALSSARPSTQPVFTGPEIFPPEEFAARRARVMAEIGNAVAILQGTTERPGEQPLRQNNQFLSLTGIGEPRAIVLIDGLEHKTIAYLQPADERRQRQIDRMYGVGLVPGGESAAAAGVDAVLSRDQFAKAIDAA